MQRIIIKHVSGSKANQVDTFAVDQCQMLTLGRGSAQTIKYDPDWDDTVSREHAKISWGADPDTCFWLTDLNSSNGTYVNKRRISGAVSLRPGDTIQLGPGGPEFHFDIDPRPDPFRLPPPDIEEVLFRPTRDMSIPNGSRKVNAPVERGLGRETVERMIDSYYQKSRRNLVRLAAVMVSVIALVTGVLLYCDFFIEPQLHQTRQETTQSIQAPINIHEEMIQRGTPNDPILSAADILEAYGPATVMIETGWNLVHAESGAQVYHRYEGGGRYPAYIKWQGQYHPWLYIYEDSDSHVPIGGEDQGSGFVVTDTGYILTSRYLVASWHAPYGGFPLMVASVFFDADAETGLVQWRANAKPITDRAILRERQQHLANWVPAREDILVKTKMMDGQKAYYVVSGRPFTGRSYKLDAVFPKNKRRTPALLASTSTAYDVALLKIDMPSAIPKVTMHDRYQDMIPGMPVTVLGYPHGLSHENHMQTSTATFEGSTTARAIPGLRGTAGVLGGMIRNGPLTPGSDGQDRSPRTGDGFQLSVRSTGRGNRGGPVFDQRGRVMGIFTSYAEDHMQTSMVIPIRFGMEIMGVPVVPE